LRHFQARCHLGIKPLGQRRPQQTPSRFVSATQTLTYKINFKNERKADIPVQYVKITERLDPNLDWTTFQVGDFTIAGTTYPAPPNDGFYRTRLDLTRTLSIYLDVTAGIDLTTGVVTWTFMSIDPTTGDLPTSFFIGFLPPDKNPSAGEASVSYTIRPYPDDPTGTVISAQAGIVFDTNDPVPTKVVANTIDAAPPSSMVAPLPPIKHRPNFVVRWSGSDDEGDSGIAFYDIYVATDDGPFVLWLAGTTATSTGFPGAFGHRYSFYSVATDNVGNQEATPDGAQAMTDVERCLTERSGSPWYPVIGGRTDPLAGDMLAGGGQRSGRTDARECQGAQTSPVGRLAGWPMSGSAGQRQEVQTPRLGVAGWPLGRLETAEKVALRLGLSL
jgi:hypothetical protein